MDSEVIGRLRDFLLGTKGLFMHVTFVKRSDGTVREMICRHGVKKYKVDPEGGYDPIIIKKDTANALLRVFDVNAIDKKTGRKGAYRMIALEGLKRIRIGKQEFTP